MRPLRCLCWRQYCEMSPADEAVVRETDPGEDLTQSTVPFLSLSLSSLTKEMRAQHTDNRLLCNVATPQDGKRRAEQGSYVSSGGSDVLCKLRSSQETSWIKTAGLCQPETEVSTRRLAGLLKASSATLDPLTSPTYIQRLDTVVTRLLSAPTLTRCCFYACAFWIAHAYIDDCCTFALDLTLDTLHRDQGR